MFVYVYHWIRFYFHLFHLKSFTTLHPILDGPLVLFSSKNNVKNVILLPIYPSFTFTNFLIIFFCVSHLFVFRILVFPLLTIFIDVFLYFEGILIFLLFQVSVECLTFFLKVMYTVSGLKELNVSGEFY